MDRRGAGGFNVTTADSGKVFILQPNNAGNTLANLPTVGLTDGLYYIFIRDNATFGNCIVSALTNNITIVNSAGVVSTQNSIATGNNTDGGRVTLIWSTDLNRWISVGPSIVFS